MMTESYRCFIFYVTSVAKNVYLETRQYRGVQIRSDSFGFRNKNIHFGLDRIDKVVS
jgi:hypothetical protein